MGLISKGVIERTTLKYRREAEKASHEGGGERGSGRRTHRPRSGEGCGLSRCRKQQCDLPRAVNPA